MWYRNCLSLLRNPDAARDATQETALRFLRGLPGFRGQSTLQTWSLGIALNVCRETRRKQRTPPPKLRLSPGTNQPPDAAMLQRERTERVQKLLDALPDRQREAVVLRYFEGLPLASIAEAMDCAVGTVKATLSQALGRLRRESNEVSP